jgi:hypothetical protein
MSAARLGSGRFWEVDHMTDAKLPRAGDEDLRARFEDLRAETRGPSFANVLERAAAEVREQPELGLVRGRSGSRRRFAKVGAWASAAIAATVAGLLLLDGDLTTTASDDDRFAELVAAYSQDRATGAWRSPTSGLLDVPGMELVRGVPSLGLPAIELAPSGGTGATR